MSHQVGSSTTEPIGTLLKQPLFMKKVFAGLIALAVGTFGVGLLLGWDPFGYAQRPKTLVPSPKLSQQVKQLSTGIPNYQSHIASISLTPDPQIVPPKWVKHYIDSYIRRADVNWEALLDRLSQHHIPAIELQLEFERRLHAFRFLLVDVANLQRSFANLSNNDAGTSVTWSK